MPCQNNSRSIFIRYLRLYLYFFIGTIVNNFKYSIEVVLQTIHHYRISFVCFKIKLSWFYNCFMSRKLYTILWKMLWIKLFCTTVPLLYPDIENQYFKPPLMFITLYPIGFLENVMNIFNLNLTVYFIVRKNHIMFNFWHPKFPFFS